MKKTFFACLSACVMLLAAQITPARADDPTSCANCKKTQRPYIICNGGSLLVECLNDPWSTGGKPGRQTLPPCPPTIIDDYNQDITVKVQRDQPHADIIGYGDSLDSDGNIVYDDNGDPIIVPIWGPIYVDYNDVTVYSDGALDGTVDGMLNNWLSICNLSDDGSGCCPYVYASTDPSDFTLNEQDKSYDWAGTTDKISFDNDCNMSCSTYIAINFTNNFLYQDQSTLQVVPYSGSSLPPVTDVNGKKTVDVVSLDNTVEHEWGHWLGFPTEEEWAKLSCPPPDGDLMNPVSTSTLNIPPTGLSDWDICWFKLLYCCSSSGVDEHKINEIPTTQQLLLSNAPNPFSDATTINYQVNANSRVTLKVYNSLGALVTTLQDGWQPAGNYAAAFNAATLPIGLYYYVLTEGSASGVRGMVRVK